MKAFDLNNDLLEIAQDMGSHFNKLLAVKKHEETYLSKFTYNIQGKSIVYLP